MPTYDYECQSCGHRFDQFQNMSAEPLRDCPSCGEPALKRLVGGGIGIIFKGSGFYVTDSKSSSGAGKKEGSKSGEAAASEGTGDSSSSKSSNSDSSSKGESGTSAKTETTTQTAG